MKVEAVYKLVDEKFGQLLKEIKELREEFNKLEAGRLTRLETEVAQIKGQLETDSESPLRRIGYKVVEYIILAVILSLLYLVLRPIPAPLH